MRSAACLTLGQLERMIEQMQKVLGTQYPVAARYAVPHL
jgi:hypothetical protein